VKKLTRLYGNKYKKGIDFPIKKSIIIIVKGIEKGKIEMVNSLLEIPLTEKHKKT